MRCGRRSTGHKEYLGILYLAARQSETAVDEALRTLLARINRDQAAVRPWSTERREFRRSPK